MKKLLYCGAAVASFPVDKLVAVESASTAVTLHFDVANSEPAHLNIEAKVVLACVAADEKALIDQLYQAVNFGREGVVDVLALSKCTAITSSVYDIVPGS